MILKLLKRVQSLEREVQANRVTGGPGIRLHRRPHGTSIQADKVKPVVETRQAAPAGRVRWG